MIVRATGYVRGPTAQAAARLMVHLKYVQYRSHELAATDGDRRLFTEEANAVPRAVAREHIMAHTNRTVSFHKVVLSPSAKEGASIGDWQQWTRTIMRDLGHRQGQPLIWYAVKHGYTAHPHVHVVIAGSGALGKAVRLTTGDFKAMIASGSAQTHPAWQEQVQMTLGADQDRHWLTHDFTPEQEQDQEIGGR